MTARLPEHWDDHFTDVPATVITMVGVCEGWEEIAARLEDAFRATRSAFRSGRSVVYVVRNDDLLGRRGSGSAMVAAGLLSAARTAALEGVRDGLTANVIAVEDDTGPADIARWATLLSEGERPTGELVHLGSGHIGKALA